MTNSRAWILRIPIDYDEADYIIVCSSEEKARELEAKLPHSFVESVPVDEELEVVRYYSISVTHWPKYPEPSTHISESTVIPGRELPEQFPTPRVRKALATFVESGKTLPYVDLFVDADDEAAALQQFDEEFTTIKKDWPAWWWSHASENERGYLERHGGKP